VNVGRRSSRMAIREEMSSGRTISRESSLNGVDGSVSLTGRAGKTTAEAIRVGESSVTLASVVETEPVRVVTGGTLVFFPLSGIGWPFVFC
jgi:hypothetical protein